MHDLVVLWPFASVVPALYPHSSIVCFWPFPMLHHCGECPPSPPVRVTKSRATLDLPRNSSCGQCSTRLPQYSPWHPTPSGHRVTLITLLVRAVPRVWTLSWQTTPPVTVTPHHGCTRVQRRQWDVNITDFLAPVAMGVAFLITCVAAEENARTVLTPHALTVAR